LLCPAPLALPLPRRSRLASRSISRAAPLPLDSLGSALHPRRSMAAATRPSSSNSLHSARRPSAASALSPVGAVGTRGWSSRIAAGTAVGRQAVLSQAGGGRGRGGWDHRRPRAGPSHFMTASTTCSFIVERCQECDVAACNQASAQKLVVSHVPLFSSTRTLEASLLPSGRSGVAETLSGPAKRSHQLRPLPRSRFTAPVAALPPAPRPPHLDQLGLLKSSRPRPPSPTSSAASSSPRQLNSRRRDGRMWIH